MIQETIYTNVALPYQNWVNDKWQAFIPAVKDITRGNDYVFVCRHAVTTALCRFLGVSICKRIVRG